MKNNYGDILKLFDLVGEISMVEHRKGSDMVEVTVQNPFKYSGEYLNHIINLICINELQKVKECKWKIFLKNKTFHLTNKVKCFKLII